MIVSLSSSMCIWMQAERSSWYSISCSVICLKISSSLQIARTVLQSGIVVESDICDVVEFENETGQNVHKMMIKHVVLQSSNDMRRSVISSWKLLVS